MLKTLTYKRLKQHKASLLVLILAFSICLALIHSFSVFYVTTKQGFIQHKSLIDVVVGPSQSKESLFKAGLLFQSSSKALIQKPKINSAYVNHIAPIIITDKFKKHPVIATNSQFFDALNNRNLTVSGSNNIESPNAVIIGAIVAKTFNFSIGDSLHLNSHGHHHHDDHDLIITGILNYSNSTLDHCLYISTTTYVDLHHSTLSEKAHFYWIDTKKPLFRYSVSNSINKNGNSSAMVPANFSKEFAGSFLALKQAISLILYGLIIIFILQAIAFFMNAFKLYLHEAKILRLHGYSILFITLNFFLDQFLVFSISSSIAVLLSASIVSGLSSSIQALILFPIQSLYLSPLTYIAIASTLLVTSFILTYISLSISLNQEKNLKI